MMGRKNDHLTLVEDKNNDPIMPAWKRFFYFLGKLLFLAGLAALLWHGEAYFRVSNIMIEGANELETDEILKAGEISQGMNIFLVKESNLATKISKQLPSVGEIEVSRELPDTVVIKITERVPAGYVLTADGFWIIDSQGVIMDYSEEPRMDYPFITGIEGSKVIPGSPIDCPARVKALQNFFGSWPGESGLEVEALDLYESHNLIIYTKDGFEIWFGEGDAMEQKIRLVRESLPYIDPSTEARLDVRCEKRLVVSGSAVLKEEGKEVDP